jgi:hypothetical protein
MRIRQLKLCTCSSSSVVGHHDAFMRGIIYMGARARVVVVVGGHQQTQGGANRHAHPASTLGLEGGQRNQGPNVHSHERGGGR